MKVKTIRAMKTKTIAALAIMGLGFTGTLRADPQLTSWFTNYSGKYARIYASDTAKTNGTTLTSWTNGTTSQALPAYCGVQEVDYSSNWVYIRSTGLGSHTMGPWYLDTNHQTLFPNWPTNTKVLFRIPRAPTVPTTKTSSGGGPIGYFVDGAAMFNSWDAYYWNGTSNVQSTGTDGYWNRDAYVNEGASFDPNNAHQAGGQYHYHANPPALRYELGDHVNFNTTNKFYTEATTTPTKHSPLLGWVADGYPIYGPYGYTVATNANSGISRMRSGYVLRNGQSNTANLTLTGRTNLPAWAVRLYGVSITNAGPVVNSANPLDTYMEDNDYLGDLGYTQGVNFDLDEYNGRYCVTPEFPNGTYAYFVSISSTGTPVFPYNIGRGYYGSPNGGTVTSITETVTTNYVGGPNQLAVLSAPKLTNHNVTLAWSATEGGTYQVVSSTNLSSWTTNQTNIGAVLNTGGYSGSSPENLKYFRVARTALASYDPVTNSTTTGGGGGSSGILSISPTSGTRGSTAFTLTINLDSNAQPAPPPQTAPINSITVGTITGSNNVHVSATQVTSSITIPAGAATNAVTVTVVFPGPPGNATNTVTYTLANGFTIH